MAAADARGGKPYTARDYILAALGACLAATAIVIIVSVVLSPGRIIFTVTNTSQKDMDDGGITLKLTTVANNTSHRAEVRFLSFFVVLTNSTSSTAKYTTDAHVEPPFPFPTGYLPGPGLMTINASVPLLAGDMVSSFTGQRLESDGSGLTVELTSQVRFRIGVAQTKIFDIRVSCPGVTFVQERPKSRVQRTFQCAG